MYYVFDYVACPACRTNDHFCVAAKEHGADAVYDFTCPRTEADSAIVFEKAGIIYSKCPQDSVAAIRRQK